MPRKTKEQNEIKNEIANEEEKKQKKSSSSKTPKKATKTTKTAKETNKSKEVSPKKTSKSKTSKATSKSTKTTSKTSTSKTSTSKRVAKTSTTKKASTTKKKSTTKKSTKKTSTSKKPKLEIVEYYDLPYRYNQTVIKVIAQTPTILFIYWDISDEDRKSFEKQYGENFFEITKPVLVVHNNTLGYSFEVEINDFANSWYLHVADSKCDYKIELGRRPIIKNENLNQDYIYVASSNQIESPNDHILFNKEQKMVYFRNIKTGAQTSKPINSITFIRNMGKIYNIYDLYKEIYKNENVEEIYTGSNPSS